MVFSSTVFLFCFLPAVLLIYYIVPFRAKNISLLIFSLLFYWWNKPSYIFLILLSITINYLGGILLSRVGKKRIRRVTLICILTARSSYHIQIYRFYHYHSKSDNTRKYCAYRYNTSGRNIFLHFSGHVIYNWHIQKHMHML